MTRNSRDGAASVHDTFWRYHKLPPNVRHPGQSGCEGIEVVDAVGLNLRPLPGERVPTFWKAQGSLRPSCSFHGFSTATV